MPAKTTLHRIFCENAKIRRTTLGLTQEKAAELMGVPQPQYARMESGGTRIRIDGIEAVAHVLQTTAAKLLEPNAFKLAKKTSSTS